MEDKVPHEDLYAIIPTPDVWTCPEDGEVEAVHAVECLRKHGVDMDCVDSIRDPEKNPDGREMAVLTLPLSMVSDASLDDDGTHTPPTVETRMGSLERSASFLRMDSMHRMYTATWFQ